MPVVGHQHDCPVEVRERFGKRFAHVEVEVVGGFVEQQHIRFAPGDQRQRQPRALTTRHHIDTLEGALGREVPLAEKTAHFLRGGLGCDVAQVIHRRRALAQTLHRVLREVTDAQIAVHATFATEWRQFTDQGLDQRRLAGAVRPEQRHAVAGFETKTDVVQDRHAAACG